MMQHLPEFSKTIVELFSSLHPFHLLYYFKSRFFLVRVANIKNYAAMHITEYGKRYFSACNLSNAKPCLIKVKCLGSG